MTSASPPAAPETAVIIVAAGRGLRAGGGLPKKWRDLAGRPVLAHTLAAFRDAPGISRLILVHHPDDRPHAAALTQPEDLLVEGGENRAESVKNALEAIANTHVSRVLIHDGAPVASIGGSGLSRRWRGA